MSWRLASPSSSVLQAWVCELWRTWTASVSLFLKKINGPKKWPLWPIGRIDWDINQIQDGGGGSNLKLGQEFLC